MEFRFFASSSRLVRAVLLTSPLKAIIAVRIMHWIAAVMFYCVFVPIATETRSMILKTADSTMSANYHPMSMVTKTTVAKTITMTPGTTPLFPSRPIKDSSTLTFSYTHTFHPSKSAFVVIATLTPSIAPSTVTSPRKEQSSGIEAL